MNKIAILSGPALGHVGRLYKIALTLQSSSSVEIHFIYPDVSPYVDKLVGDHFKTFAISAMSGRDFPENAVCFAQRVEEHFSKYSYDLIVQDANPLLWLSLIRFPDIPKINITNSFLTQLRPEATAQELTFNRVIDELNKLRSNKGLIPLNDAYELYEADRVLLADPKPIVDLLGPLPPHYIQCGACSWEFDGVLPQELDGKKDILLLSMGSTGKSQFDSGLLKALQLKIGDHTSVYSGNKVGEIRQAYDFDFLYEWLPLNEVLDRSKAVISQGGTGSSYQALAKGNPVFVFPTHKNHKSLANLLQTVGVGYCIDEQSTIEDIQQIDFEVMSQTVKEYTISVSKENGPIKIANIISGLL